MRTERKGEVTPAGGTGAPRRDGENRSRESRDTHCTVPRPCGRGPAWPAGPAPLVRSSAPRGRVLPVLRPLTPRSLSTSQAPAGRVMEAQSPPHRVGAPWEGLSRARQVPHIPSYAGLPLDQRAPVILDPGYLTEAPTKQLGFIYGALTGSTPGHGQRRGSFPAGESGRRLSWGQMFLCHLTKAASGRPA